jgi:hypothetical protein
LPVPLIVSGIIFSRRWSELLSGYEKIIEFRMNMLKEMEKKMSGIENVYHREDLLYPKLRGD